MTVQSLNASVVSTEAALTTPAEIAAWNAEYIAKYGAPAPHVMFVEARTVTEPSIVAVNGEPVSRVGSNVTVQDAPITASTNLSAAALGNVFSVEPSQSTLNVNQASCLIERPLFEGREYINVCTGQKTLVPYSAPELIFGVVFLLFAGFIVTQLVRGFMGRRV